MKKLSLFVISLLITAQIEAYDGVTSEAAHFATGAVMAGGVTAIVDQYYPEYQENRGMIGFGISTAIGIVQQAFDYDEYGNVKGQVLDAVAHLAGAALGAYVTDGYILSPVITNSKSEGEYVGLNFQYTF